MNNTGIIFPHQLFEDNPLLQVCNKIYLVEEWLYFKQYNFHQQKIAFHRAAMKGYAHYLQSKNIQVEYIDALNKQSDIRKLLPALSKNGVTHLSYIDTTDNWLQQRLTKTAKANKIQLKCYPTPLFINTTAEIEQFFLGRKRMFQTDFYKHQRVSRNILLDGQNNPVGGKWTFDDENRLKYPKDKTPPKVTLEPANEWYKEAVQYTQQNFSANYGALHKDSFYPTTFEESKKWMKTFLQKRFAEFGPYEDALVSSENYLHHSVLTPMLNVGLLTPQYVIDETLKYASKHQVAINSTEGFIRQVVGWREFIRAVYQIKGSEERTKNYWGFTRKIPKSFWTGTTGILPVDITIKKVLETGYCHHIERLMVLGNFMLLCEFDPNDVYRWFMEMFIDAYDWVMVPNVYGMSQFADGGLMATKPYISGSNYLMKMSDYPKGEWQTIWDGLFWRFMHVHCSFFLQNPRLGMLVKTFEKMPEQKRIGHLQVAEKFLEGL